MGSQTFLEVRGLCQGKSQDKGKGKGKGVPPPPPPPSGRADSQDTSKLNPSIISNILNNVIELSKTNVNFNFKDNKKLGDLLNDYGETYITQSLDTGEDFIK